MMSLMHIGKEFSWIFKTHPTFVFSLNLMPSTACQTLFPLFLGHPVYVNAKWYFIHLWYDWNAKYLQQENVGIEKECCAGVKNIELFFITNISIYLSIFSTAQGKLFSTFSSRKSKIWDVILGIPSTPQECVWLSL